MVIANGAAVQRVPGGLRLLQKTCRDANVLLYVVNDPRAWGGNTHHDLTDALRDVRRAVKRNIISQAMEQQSGFSRGRIVGKMERRAQEALERANEERQRRQEAIRQRQWEDLDAVSLEKRLVEHGVIQRDDVDGTVRRYYTPGMVEVARKCMSEETERQK